MRGVKVKLNKLAASIGIVAVAVGVAASALGPASAASNIKPFGQPETLIGPNGAPQVTYTVHGLNPSSAPVPHNGQLYEATMTIDAFGRVANPEIQMFNARAENRAMYRLLTAAGIGGAVPPGGSATGKLYFEVVGEAPNSVVYNDGTRDIVAWVPGPPQGGTRP